MPTSSWLVGDEGVRTDATGHRARFRVLSPPYEGSDEMYVMFLHEHGSPRAGTSPGGGMNGAVLLSQVSERRTHRTAADYRTRRNPLPALMAVAVVVLPYVTSALGTSLAAFNALPRAERRARAVGALRSRALWVSPPVAITARQVAKSPAAVDALLDLLAERGQAGVSAASVAAHGALAARSTKMTSTRTNPKYPVGTHVVARLISDDGTLSEYHGVVTRIRANQHGRQVVTIEGTQGGVPFTMSASTKSLRKSPQSSMTAKTNPRRNSDASGPSYAVGDRVVYTDYNGVFGMTRGRVGEYPGTVTEVEAPWKPGRDWRYLVLLDTGREVRAPTERYYRREGAAMRKNTGGSKVPSSPLVAKFAPNLLGTVEEEDAERILHGMGYRIHRDVSDRHGRPVEQRIDRSTFDLLLARAAMTRIRRNPPASKGKTFAIGDLVRHTADFRRSVGMYTGNVNGVVVAHVRSRSMPFPVVFWSEGDVSPINPANLEHHRVASRSEATIQAAVREGRRKYAKKILKTRGEDRTFWASPEGVAAKAKYPRKNPHPSGAPFHSMLLVQFEGSTGSGKKKRIGATTSWQQTGLSPEQQRSRAVRSFERLFSQVAAAAQKVRGGFSTEGIWVSIGSAPSGLTADSPLRVGRHTWGEAARFTAANARWQAEAWLDAYPYLEGRAQHFDAARGVYVLDEPSLTNAGTRKNRSYRGGRRRP